MNRGPLVSTIIPTYNRASLLCAAIESVRQQSYPDIEIIVVDDGSTDDTQARLRQYRDQVRVIVQDNAGPGRARNRGIEAARGEIVAFLDSDDTWKASKIERQVRLLERLGESVPCCLCNALMVSPDGQQVPTFQYSELTPALEEGVWENVAEVLATRFVLFTQTIAIRRKVIERIGGFDDGLQFLEDYEFPLRLSLDGPWGFINEPLVLYHRESPGSYAALAEANELELRECAAQMRTSLWNTVRDDAEHRHLRTQFFVEFVAARALMRAAQLRRSANRPLSALGSTAFQIDRYRRALYRRSPWYPKMRVRSTVAQTSVARQLPARARTRLIETLSGK